MIEFSVLGGDDVRRAAAKLAAEKKAQRRNMIRALERGVRGLRRTIPQAAARLPSGYAPTMAADVQVSTSVRLSRDPGLSVRVWAEGSTASPEHRHLAQIDAGNLRHPRFGDRTRWYDQAVRPHFATEPFLAAKPAILDEIEDEWNAMVARMERG